MWCVDLQSHAGSHIGTMQTQPIEQLPVKRKRKASDKPKHHRISKLVRDACQLIADGEVKTILGAAERLKCSREHLSRQLQRDHVQDYLRLEAKRKISSAVLRAASKKLELLDCESARVANDVASDILAIAGITVPRDGRNSSVSVSVQAGYVINLTEPTKQSPTIDIKADVVDA